MIAGEATPNGSIFCYFPNNILQKYVIDGLAKFDSLSGMKRLSKPTWEPTVADFEQVLVEQNPWQVDGRVPEAWAREVERPLARSLWKLIERDTPHRFQLVLGPRRVGKTTAMYQTVRHLLANHVPPRRVWWLRLDHPLLMNVPMGQLVRSATKTATPESPIYLFLDEITYADQWDLWLKTFYDESWPIRIVGTSSATAALRDRRLESGVGRWEEQYLSPYSFKEYLELRGATIPPWQIGANLAETLNAWFEDSHPVAELADDRRRFILIGGFPELLLSHQVTDATDEKTLLLQSQRTLRSDAVERAIYKDIPQTFGLDNPMMLERLLYTLAGQFTGILSPTTIGQTLGLSQPTFDRYLSYLERAFLVFTLVNYSGSEGAKQKRGRKLYFVDGAVRNAALQRGVGPLSDSTEMGLLFENLVASHLHSLGQQSQVRLYYWRDKDDEIDLVYDHPDAPLAFEIASSGSHSRAGIRAFIERFPRFRNRCYLVAPGVAPKPAGQGSDGIGFLPLDVLLLAISSQTERELAARLGG
jgi:predicted AAA+ superfamily ATPase